MIFQSKRQSTDHWLKRFSIFVPTTSRFAKKYGEGCSFSNAFQLPRRELVEGKEYGNILKALFQFL